MNEVKPLSRLETYLSLNEKYSGRLYSSTVEWSHLKSNGEMWLWRSWPKQGVYWKRVRDLIDYIQCGATYMLITEKVVTQKGEY